MRGNGKVFISHAHDDNERCAPLLAALDAWGVDYWFDTRRLEAGDDLSREIQRAIAARDIFLRICTPAAQRSYWVRLETGAFRGLQARQHRAGGDPVRVLINLILDAAYEPEPFDFAHIFIDASARPRREWLEELRRALGVVAPSTQATPLHPAALASLPAGPRIYVVDQRGDGEFPTISSALMVASDGDVIHLRSGHYQDELVIEKSLTLRGEGDRSQIVVEGASASALRIESGVCHIENLTLRQLGAPHLDCVAILGGQAELVQCDITTQTQGACVNITSPDEVTLRENVIHDGHGWGVFVAGKGNVTLEDNQISGHANSGVTVMRGSYVLARRNRITRNAQYAVRVDADAGGTFEDNDLRGNYLSAWKIEPQSFGRVLQKGNKG